MLFWRCFCSLARRRNLPRIDNLILDALPREVLDELSPSTERITLPFRQEVYPAGGRVDAHVFPIDCIVSVVASMQDGAHIEVSEIGREGFTGAATLVDAGRSTFLTFCQVAGDAYRIPAEVFAEVSRRHDAVRRIVGAYLATTLDVLGQYVACNRLHYTSERAARWLLMTHDRVGRNEFPLTHEILATMLGVRRAGISLAAAALQDAGYISYARGRFTITDRAGLESAACECYAAQNAFFERHGLRVPRLGAE